MSTKLYTKQRHFSEKLQPIQRRRTQGTMYETEYTHGRVHMDFDPDDVFPDTARYGARGDAVFYRYPGKPPVMINENGVFKHKHFDETKSEKQAYHVLSMLDAKGFVAGWRQK